jgi:transposase
MSENIKRSTKQYTKDYKTEAVKLVREIGITKAAIELGIPKSTLSQWLKRAKIGDLDTGAGTQTPGSAITQAMEIQQLRAEIKNLVKDNARLKKENDFLEEASAFFAASRQRLAKKSE